MVSEIFKDGSTNRQQARMITSRTPLDKQGSKNRELINIFTTVMLPSQSSLFSRNEYIISLTTHWKYAQYHWRYSSHIPMFQLEAPPKTKCTSLEIGNENK